MLSLRPTVHFTPRAHWINDPNGLIWHAGEYHLFYQYNPQASVWGNMSWGHAVSSDLLHWQELPVAIPQDESWMIFSGSMVVDHDNRAGFNRDGEPAMVAIYTGSAQRPDEHGVYRQTQQLAYSLDKGRSFTKYAGNPVLDLGQGGFRDPKVFWHAAAQHWVMLVSMADEGYLRFFTSADLKRWVPQSEYRVELPGCRVWECPDLLELALSDDAGPEADRPWFLKFDVFEGHPAGGSGALGVFGQFDGYRFSTASAPQWLDAGADFYAAIAFAQMPPGDHRKIWLGWMNNHRYAAATPTAPWRGQMSLPRELSATLHANGSWKLLQQPIRELTALRREVQRASANCLPAAQTLRLNLRSSARRLGSTWDLECELTLGTAMVIELRILDAQGTAAMLILDRKLQRLCLRRVASAQRVAHPSFVNEQSMLWPGASADLVQLRMVLDAQSIEVFVCGADAVISSLVFPQGPPESLVLKADAELPAAQLSAWPLQAGSVR